MKIDHENSLADIASISVALRTDSVKVVSGIRNCALESNCLVVTQELNHGRQWVLFVSPLHLWGIVEEFCMHKCPIFSNRYWVRYIDLSIVSHCRLNITLMTQLKFDFCYFLDLSQTWCPSAHTASSIWRLIRFSYGLPFRLVYSGN